MNHILLMVDMHFLQHWYFKLLTKHNTPPIHKLSQQQNKTQMLLLVLVHYSVAAIGHDSYAGFNTHYDAGWK